VVLRDQPARLDTRGGPPVRGPIDVSGLSYVTVIGAGSPGTVTLAPCAQLSTAAPSGWFGEVGATFLTVANDAPMCVTTSVPAHVIADSAGLVSAAPSPTGLQYVPTPAPVTIFDEVTPAGGYNVSTPLTISDVPPEARGVVLRVEVDTRLLQLGVDIDRCDYHVGTSTTAYGDGGLGLVYTRLLPGDHLCMRTYTPVHVRVVLLGFLSTEGPDPTRLPPTVGLGTAEVPGPGLDAITPTRVLDTRDGTGVTVARRVRAGEVIELDLYDYTTDVSTAAVLNVTVVDPDEPGFLTAYPCDEPRPLAASITYERGETIANQVVVKLSPNDTVCLFAYSATDIVADLSGTFEALGAGAGIHPVTPDRLLDTRAPIGVPAAAKVNAGQVLELQVGGRDGVPATDVHAVTMNVTATQPDGPGYITAYPCDAPRPTAANLNYIAGQTVANLVTVRVSATGTVCLFTYANAHLVADMAAWYSTDDLDGFRELVADRLLDTRTGLGAPTGPVATGGTLVLQVADRSGVPLDGVTAVTMNVTVTQTTGPGFITVYPCDTARPTAANLTYAGKQTISNLVTVKLSSAGTVCMFAYAGTHLVADVAGYFSPAGDLIPVPAILGA